MELFISSIIFWKITNHQKKHRIINSFQIQKNSNNDNSNDNCRTRSSKINKSYKQSGNNNQIIGKNTIKNKDQQQSKRPLEVVIIGTGLGTYLHSKLFID